MASGGNRRHADATFSVSYTHRLRFTEDVLGADRQELLDVLEPGGPGPARVQFWVDRDVATARPALPQQLRALAAAHPDRVELAGNVQLVPGGEQIKNDTHILERMLKVMHAGDLDRRSYVVVIGGGAVLDAVGFTAAIAHRGIRLVRLPTTTLAQGDSGVGVKNSANLFGKKNWIGTFAVPWAVINDAELLRTLPDRQFVCGFSESIKVALLKDAGFFDRLCEMAPRLRKREAEATGAAIYDTARLHLDHITRGGDPFEEQEARPLDFGHWSAHKLEALSNFELSHGEAVAIGVAIDTVYSTLAHGLDPKQAERVLRCIDRLGLKLDHPAVHKTDELFAGIEEFRQHLGGQLTLTMLRGVGDPINAHEVDGARMRQAIERVTHFAASREPQAAVAADFS